MKRALGAIAFVIVVALGVAVASAISVMPNETFTFVADQLTPSVVPNVATAL